MDDKRQSVCECGGHTSAAEPSNSPANRTISACMAAVPEGFKQALTHFGSPLPVAPAIAELPGSIENVQPRRLTEMTLNLAALDHPTPGLSLFADRPLAVLVCNTHEDRKYPHGLLDFGEPVYGFDGGWPCGEDVLMQRGPGKCAGLYVSYDPATERAALDRLLAAMKACGLESTLGAPVRGCCKAPGKTYVKISLQPDARIGKGMGRIAEMMGSTTKWICLNINLQLNDIDRYAKAPADSQINPDQLRDRDFTPAGTTKTYRRSQCELLAHVIAENFIGKYYPNAPLSYEEAHARALAEENWVRHANGKEPIEPGPNDEISRNIMLGQTRIIKKQEENRQCSNPSTVSCANQCPGGRCCPDQVTPAGWIPCRDICTPGAGPWCP